MTDKQDLRVAITGGTSGLGLALMRRFRSAGAAVAFTARSPERVTEIARAHPGAYGIVADVADKEMTYPTATQIGGFLGGLDVLVNNASSLGPTPLALLADTSCEAFERAIDTNLLGAFRLTKALLGLLAASARERRGGVVVNISSDAAATPYENWGAYGASKAALDHMSRIWDRELAPEGIRVLALDPGDMDTPLHALALPGADPAALKQPGDAAEEIFAAIAAALPKRQPETP